jgi:ABC-2 type transport system ATP-binding protein
VSTLIEIDNLSKRFGALTAVDGVSFKVARGEVLGFLGPNGAGKTTTMRMVTGFLKPDSGRISVSGHDVAEDDIAAKAAIGYLPEGAPLYGDMTAAGFLRFIAETRGVERTRANQRFDWAVERLGLGSVLHQSIDTLSKGYKRRVGLAQALIHDPEVLILDEPTDGLDPNQKHEVRTLINEMASEKAIVISTHLLDEVDAVCSRAMIINEGRIVADGTPVELAARSRFHNAVRVTVRGIAAPELSQALGKITGVAEVTTTLLGADAVRCTLFPSDGAGLLAEVSRHVQSSDWTVDEFGVETGRLEDVFRTITIGGADAASGEEAAK